MLSCTTLCVLTTLLFVISTNTAVALPRPAQSERTPEPQRETSPDQNLELLRQVERIIDRAEASGRFDASTIGNYRWKLHTWRFQSEVYRQSVMEAHRQMPWLHDVDMFDEEQVWESQRRFYEEQRDNERRQIRERLFRERGITPP